jgi:hypothetical protein
MSDLNVEHYLVIYQTRQKMQEEGLTNPTQEFKEITQIIVDKLSKLPLGEKIILDDHKIKDSRGNVIVEFPFKKQ